MQTISPFLPMNNGKKIKIGNYFLGKTIGKGNSAVVKVAVHGLTKQLVAIKIFDKNALDVEKQVRLRREIDSMKRLKHPNIIRLYEIMETNKLICLVTEYASNGELYDYIIENKRLSERKAREIFRQILASLNHCHSCGIVHRDLKVENLLFDSTRRIKLADFGFSCTFKPGELLDVFCGSPPYCAPELYLAHLYDGPKVDIWSLGVVLYVLVCGYLPFDAQSFNILRSQVISGSYKIPFFLSEDCKNLIKGMLMIDPSKRFDINEILNHRWLKTVESDDTASENGFPIGEMKNLKEFRNLISKIENISIEEFEPNQDVLNELLKYNLNLNEVIKSVKNNEFDSNAGIYYLTEAKLLSRVGGGGGGSSMGDQLSLKSPIKFSPLISVEATSNNSPQLSATLDHKYFTFGAEAGKSDESSPFYGYHKVNMIADDQESVRSGGSSSSTTATTSSTATTASEQQAMAVAAAAAAAAAASIFAAASTGASTETNSNCDEDEMPPIEELGRDYLSRYNSIRRHTIATNEDNEMLGQSNNIMKSTECLLNFGQGSGEPIIDTRKNSSEESTVQSCSSTSSGIAGGSNTNNTSGNSHLSNGFTADLVKCFNLSLNPNNSGSSSESRFESTSPTAMSSNPYTTVRKSSQNEIELNRQHQQLMSGGLGKTKTKSHVMHTHYCKSKSINSKCLNLQQQQQPQQPQLGVPPALLTSPSHLMQQQPQQQPYILPPKPYHQSYQVGPYLSPPILSGRRASDGGSNISLFNHIYSLKHSHKPSCNDSFTDNVQGGVGSELMSDMSGDLSSQLGGVENNLGSSSSALAAAVAAYNSCGGENQSNDNTSLDQDQALSPAAAAMTARMSKPRGSITSGMPISMLKSQLSGAGSGTNLKTNNAASSFQSASEDEDSNCCVLQPPLIFTPTNISAALLMQHRKSSGRQTSELAASFGGLDTGSGGASIVRGSSSTRQREQSFSGTNSSPMYFTINENLSDLNHRSSVPNQFDLIHANRLHLEKIYNQSIDNSKQQHIIAVAAAAAAVSNKEVPPRLYDNQASERGDEIKVNGDEQMDDSICAPNANFMVNFCPQIVENQLQNEKLLPSINQQQQSVVSPQVTPSSSNSSSSNGETSANNSTMDPSPSSHLQMIQEEQQNEIAAMMSSESSSLCSSVSTTPRMSRTSFGAPPSSQHHRAAANSETGLPPPPLIITPNEVYSYQPPHHYNRQPAPQIDDELMAFESDDRRPKKSKNCTIDT